MMAMPGNVSRILDTLKVADTALFLVSARHHDGIDEIGEQILISCLAQGLPSTIVAVPDFDSLCFLVRIIESSYRIHVVNHCVENRPITGFVEIPVVLILFLRAEIT